MCAYMCVRISPETFENMDRGQRKWRGIHLVMGIVLRVKENQGACGQNLM